jgi:hypothetical protein
VLIALKTGLGFTDFLRDAAPIALAVDVATFLICRWYFAESFASFGAAVNAEFAVKARPVSLLATIGGGKDVSEQAGGGSDDDFASDAVSAGQSALSDSFFSTPAVGSAEEAEAKKAFHISWILLSALVLLLVTHKQAEGLLGRMFHTPLTSPDGAIVHAADGSIVYALREGTMMVGAALIMGSVVLFLARTRARELVERRVDWWTLSFFMMLFASVGTLQDTGVTEVIAAKLSGIGGSQMTIIQVIGWATGWLSAFLDNVLAVATFMPVVHDIRSKAGVPFSSAIYWFMLFGGTFMGNMTIIGSTANIVAVGLLERRGHGTVRFGYWMKIGFIVAIASMILATVLLQLQSRWLPMMQAPAAIPTPG